MSATLLSAGEALAAAIAAENAALGEVGLPQAEAAAQAKLAALEVFSAALAEAPPIRRDMKAMVLIARLKQLAASNQDALAGAVRLQEAVLEAVREAMGRSRVSFRV